jgi:hypothetical protein
MPRWLMESRMVCGAAGSGVHTAEVVPVMLPVHACQVWVCQGSSTPVTAALPGSACLSTIACYF